MALDPSQVDEESRANAHDLLNELEETLTGRFGASNPARVEQLKAHLPTLHMIVDHLHEETPGVPA